MKLPILMFHKVDTMPAGAVHHGNYVDPALFEALLQSLRGDGYESVTIEQWLAWKAGRATLPARPIVFTFDDGYRSNMEVAWPIMQRHGFTGTIFLVSDLIGSTNRWDADEIQEPLLARDEILELRAAGMTFGSHTRTHAALTRLSLAELRSELEESRLTLEALLGEPVRVLCYPFGKQNPEVRRAASLAGYTAAVRGLGRMNSRWQDQFALRRIKVTNATTPGSLRRQLATLRWLVWW
jgi:peptidoglycan/xylan/chitin deacetylase (PgdA/CDA1 family)